MNKSGTFGTGGRSPVRAVAVVAAVLSCVLSIASLLRGLVREGPAFYNGSECRMTYSRYRFYPLRLLRPPPSSSSSLEEELEERYRLLKFSDARDPRHERLRRISGSLAEDYETRDSSPRRKREGDGRLLELRDDWCLLSSSSSSSSPSRRGHAVLFVPGHWGSFSQARSLGAHGTRWTGQKRKPRFFGGEAGGVGNINDMSDREIYESLRTGERMHDGRFFGRSRHRPEEFVMDVFALDFDGEGAALHPSKLSRQAEFIARAVETIARGCGLDDNNNDDDEDEESTAIRGGRRRRRDVTIVAHSVGAWSTLIALRTHPRLSGEEGWVRNVVTLASPLASIPYPVDPGVHDVARRVGYDENENDDAQGDVAIVSVSGGLRDEVIPPETCQRRTVSPPPPGGGDRNGGAYASEAFLAASVARSSSDDASPSAGASEGGGRFGMDHRAAVWCHEPLDFVREIVLALTAATDQGLNSAERVDVARKVAYGGGGETEDEGVEADRGTKNASGGEGDDDNVDPTYRAEVNDQHARLLREKGYWTTVSIQLAAPYRLGALLKLCILAVLLHTDIMMPILKAWRRRHGFAGTRGVHLEKLFDASSSLIVIPSLMLAVIWMRQSEFSLLGRDLPRACDGHECQLLLGTVFVLSQLATLIYFLIVFGVCAFFAEVCDKCCKLHNNPAAENRLTSKQKSFRATFLHSCARQLLLLALVVLPSTTAVCFGIHTLLHGNEDLAWNRTAAASYCLLSLLLLTSLHLIILACRRPTSPTNSGSRRSELLVLFLSLVKAAFGKTLYAFSLISRLGQSGLDSYDEFLGAMRGSAGAVGRHRYEMVVLVLTTVFPAFIAVMTFRTHDIMARNSTCYGNEMNQINGNGCTGIMKQDSTKRTSPHKEITIITAARLCFACWYLWNVLVNFPEDDRLVPFYALTLIATNYMRSCPFSHEVMDVYAAASENDLSLRCESPQNHDKNE